MASNGHADKDLERGYDDASPEEKARNALTNTLTLSPQQFEQLYLAPKGQVTGSLRTTLANPTPIALLGFSVGLFPLAIAFLGWRGAGGNAIATTTASLVFGGFLLFIAAGGEFLLGNTFPMVVFFGYGAHFFTLAFTFIPWFNASGFFAASTEGAPIAGLESPVFLSSYAFYLIAMGMLSFIYFIGSLRTNIVFVLIFVLATLGFELGAGGFFALANGHDALANKLIIGLGACFFGADMCGWYLLLANMITTMELPIPDLPVFDLSTVIKARPRGVAKVD